MINNEQSSTNLRYRELLIQRDVTESERCRRILNTNYIYKCCTKTLSHWVTYSTEVFTF